MRRNNLALLGIAVCVSAVSLGAGTASAFAAGPNGECTCRYQGGDVIEGQTACIRTSRGLTLARCERFLNNTSWKFLDQPCPQAKLSTEAKIILR